MRLRDSESLFFYDGVNYSDIAEYKVIPRAWYMQF